MVVRLSRWLGSSRAEGRRPRARLCQQRISSPVSASTNRHRAGGRTPAAEQDRPAHRPDPVALLSVCVPGPGKHWVRYFFPYKTGPLFVYPNILCLCAETRLCLVSAGSWPSKEPSTILPCASSSFRTYYLKSVFAPLPCILPSPRPNRFT